MLADAVIVAVAAANVHANVRAGTETAIEVATARPAGTKVPKVFIIVSLFECQHMRGIFMI